MLLFFLAVVIGVWAYYHKKTGKVPFRKIEGTTEDRQSLVDPNKFVGAKRDSKVIEEEL